MVNIISVTEAVVKYGVSRKTIKDALRRGEIGGFKKSYRNIFIYDDERLKAFANRILPIKPDTAYPEYKTIKQIMSDYKVSHGRIKKTLHGLKMKSIKSSRSFYVKITNEFERALKQPCVRTGWRALGITPPQKDKSDRFLHANTALNQIIAAFRKGKCHGHTISKYTDTRTVA